MSRLFHSKFTFALSCKISTLYKTVTNSDHINKYIPARHGFEVYDRSKHPTIKTWYVKCFTLILHAWSNFIVYGNLGQPFFVSAVCENWQQKGIVEKSKKVCGKLLWGIKFWTFSVWWLGKRTVPLQPMLVVKGDWIGYPSAWVYRWATLHQGI
jgi:hypothetical protein